MARNGRKNAYTKELLEAWAVEALREIGNPSPAGTVIKVVFCNHFVEIFGLNLFFDYGYLMRWAVSESELIQTSKSTKKWALPWFGEPKECDCGCHKPGSSIAHMHACCDGTCPVCGKGFTYGLTQHRQECMVNTLRAALEKWGNHDQYCDKMRDEHGQCTCGWDKAHAELKEKGLIGKRKNLLKF